MKELLKLDTALKRVHKYKIVKDGCFELPDYLVVEQKNPEFYVQFVKTEGMKIYTLNSKSLDKNIERIGVKIVKPSEIVFTGFEDELKKLEEELDKFLEGVFSEVDSKITLTKSDGSNSFYKIKENKSTNKKWWEFWK